MTDTNREAVARFDWESDSMSEYPDGDYVLEHDYAALLIRAETAEAESAALREALEQATMDHAEAFGAGIDHAQACDLEDEVNELRAALKRVDEGLNYIHLYEPNTLTSG